MTSIYNSYMFQLCAFLAIVGTVIGFLLTAPKRYCLGICVPAEKLDSPLCRSLRRRALERVVCCALIIGSLFYIVGPISGIIPVGRDPYSSILNQVNMIGLILSMSHLLFLIVAFIWGLVLPRRALLKTIREEDWFPEQNTGQVIIDTSVHKHKRSISPYWLLVFPVIIAVTWRVFSTYRPELFPELFSDYFFCVGVITPWPLAFISSGELMILAKNLMLAMQVVVFVFVLSRFFGYAQVRQVIDPRDHEEGLKYDLRRRRMNQASFVFAFAMVCVFLGIMPYMFYLAYILPVQGFLLQPSVILANLVAIYYTTRIGIIPNNRSVAGVKPSRFFYSNDDDPALYLWSQNGNALKINMGRPLGKMLVHGQLIFAVLLVGYCCYISPLSDRFAPQDVSFYSPKHESQRRGAAILAEASFRNSDVYNPIPGRGYTKSDSISVKGTIEFFKLESKPKHFIDRSVMAHWLEELIDGERSLEHFHEDITLEKVREDKVVFGNIAYMIADENRPEERSEEQKRTEDGEMLDAVLYLRDNYDDFDFRKMGRLEGYAGRVFIPVVNMDDLPPDQLLRTPGFHFGTGFPYTQKFVDAAAILGEYYGYEMFRIEKRVKYDNGSGEAIRLRSRNLTSGSSWVKLGEYDIDPNRGFVVPRMIERSHGSLSMGTRSSGYFHLGENCYVPEEYMKVRLHFDLREGSRATVLRVRLNPETVARNRVYQEKWNRETDQSVYVEVKGE